MVSNIKQLTEFFKIIIGFDIKGISIYNIKNIENCWKKIIKCIILLLPRKEKKKNNLENNLEKKTEIDNSINSGKIIYYKFSTKSKKKKKHTKTPIIVTEVYIKFNIQNLGNLHNRLNLLYSKINYTQISYYHIGASHLTLTKNYKKCFRQKIFNKFNVDILTKMSNIPINIDFSNWDNIKINLFKKLNEKLKLDYKYMFGVDLNTNTISQTIDDLNDELRLLNDKITNLVISI